VTASRTATPRRCISRRPRCKRYTGQRYPHRGRRRHHGARGDARPTAGAARGDASRRRYGSEAEVSASSHHSPTLRGDFVEGRDARIGLVAPDAHLDPTAVVEQAGGDNLCVGVDDPQGSNAHARIEGLLDVLIVAAGVVRQHLAHPVGHERDGAVGRNRWQARTPPAREVGRHFGGARQRDAGFGQDDPTPGAPAAALEGRAQRGGDLAGDVLVNAAGAGHGVEDPVEDLALHVRRQRVDVGQRRGMIELPRGVGHAPKATTPAPREAQRATPGASPPPRPRRRRRSGASRRACPRARRPPRSPRAAGSGCPGCAR
jgi:hypothetical protein